MSKRNSHNATTAKTTIATTIPATGLPDEPLDAEIRKYHVQALLGSVLLTAAWVLASCTQIYRKCTQQQQRKL